MTNTHDLSLSIESWQLCRPATAKLNRVGPYQSHVSHINEVLQVSKPRQTQFMHNITPTSSFTFLRGIAWNQSTL